MKNTYTRRRAAATGVAVATLVAGFGLLAASAQTAQDWDINPASCRHAPHHQHKHGVQLTTAQTLCDRINAAGKDIGTGGETWPADLTQRCDGPNVAAGATSCPGNANFVPYQSGGEP